MKKLLIIIATMLCFFFPELLFSQINNKRSPNTTTDVKQTDTSKSKGLYSVQAYFSGNGLPNVKVYACYGSDLNLLLKQVDSASNGAIVTFDYIKFIDSKGATKEIKEIPYTFNRAKDTLNLKSQSLQELEKLMSYNYISGTIYFSGTNFPNVTSTKANNSTTLTNYYQRSGPGTTITFDRCIYKKTDGGLSTPLSKSIKLD